MTTVKLSPIVVIGTALLGFSIVALAMEGLGRWEAVLLPEGAVARPSPAESVEVTVEATPCGQAAGKLMEACRFGRVPVEDCEATDASEALFGPRHKRVKDGHYLSFGSPGPEWYVDTSGEVWATNGDAEQSCPGLQNIDVLVRERARAVAMRNRKGDPTACSMSDIRVAEHVADALDGMPADADEEEEAQAFTLLASALEMDRADVEDAWSKVMRLCPEAM